MGEYKGGSLEINENKMQSTRTPDLLGTSLSCKESLDVFRANTTNAAEMCGLPSNEHLLSQLKEPESREVNSSQAIQRDYGHLHCMLDEQGGLYTVSDGHGRFFMKQGDKWSLTIDGEKGSREVKDLQISKDGSYSYKDASGKFSFDKEGRLTEAPAGDGHSRKYHYDKDGHIDQIEGRLGHWERQVKDGHASWINKGTKAVWQGDFKLNNDGTLEFDAASGIAWGFTTHGKDVRIK
jgi:hypothetical protein